MELEYCIECEEPTGKAGRNEDSIFIYNLDKDIEIGPLCDDCHDIHIANEKGKQVASMQKIEIQNKIR